MTKPYFERAVSLVQVIGKFSSKFSSFLDLLDRFVNLEVVSLEEMTAIKYPIRGFSECSRYKTSPDKSG